MCVLYDMMSHLNNSLKLKLKDVLLIHIVLYGLILHAIIPHYIN